MNSHVKKKGLGFTLIEVLVAVTVIGLTVPALMLLMMQQTDYAGVLRDTTIANWVAQNKATELRLERTFLKQLQQRSTIEKVEMSGVEWEVNTEVENTLEGALVLYRIKVSLDRASLSDGIESTESAAEPLVTLETFLHGN